MIVFVKRHFTFSSSNRDAVIVNASVQGELGEMETWQEDSNAWEDESDAAWETELVLR